MRILAAAVIFCCACAAASGSDWPGLRGPRHRRGAAAGRLEASEGAGFAVAWRSALGAGYSSVAVGRGSRHHAALRRQGRRRGGFRRAQWTRAVALCHRADAGRQRAGRSTARSRRRWPSPTACTALARAGTCSRSTPPRGESSGGSSSRRARARPRRTTATPPRRCSREGRSWSRSERRTGERSPASIPRPARGAGARATTSSPTRCRWW